MNVLLISPDERMMGGGKFRALEVAKGLKEDGIKVTIAMPHGRDKAFANLLQDSGIPHHQVRFFKRLHPISHLVANVSWLTFFIPGVVALSRLIKVNRADIVHVNGGTCLQGALAAKLARVKLVWHLNDAHLPKLIKMVLSPALRFLPDKVVLSAMGIRDYYFGDRKVVPKEIEVLYAPVDTRKFHLGYDVHKYRAEFRLADSEKVVGVVANFSPAKGYEHFLPAAKMVREAYPGVKFLLVGRMMETQKKYWQLIQQLIRQLGMEQDIVLTGHRSDIPEIMNLIDIFSLPSVSEACPIVVLEAMACGKPVVASNVGGVPELIVDGQTGILVPPRDPEAMAKAVLYLLDHPDKAKEIGLKAREHVIRHFDIEKCVARHKELYISLAGVKPCDCSD